MPFMLTGEPPEDMEAFKQWVIENFRRMEEYSIDPDIVKTQVLYVEPKKKREGLIVIADGTSWNPGSGAGTYVYRSGARRKMD